MSESAQTLLQHFKTRKASKDSSVVLEARRLVNLYRSLSCFGDDFVDKYNQMLIAASPNVRRLLGTFVGGEEVADYLEFLEQNAHLTPDQVKEKTDNLVQNKGYLPEPEADITEKSSEGMVTISQKEWEKMKKDKENLIIQTQKMLNASGNAPDAKKSSTSSFENYSEIIEENLGEKEHE